MEFFKIRTTAEATGIVAEIHHLLILVLMSGKDGKSRASTLKGTTGPSWFPAQIVLCSFPGHPRHECTVALDGMPASSGKEI